MIILSILDGTKSGVTLFKITSAQVIMPVAELRVTAFLKILTFFRRSDMAVSGRRDSQIFLNGYFFLIFEYSFNGTYRLVSSNKVYCGLILFEQFYSFCSVFF